MNNETTNLLYNDLWQNFQICKRPELPKITISKDNVNYHITDLTYLNQDAVAMIFKLMSDAIANPNVIEFEYGIPDKMEKENLKLIVDIVTNIDFKAAKRGRNGWSVSGSFLINGCMTETVRNRKIVTFFINKEHSRIIKDYVKKWGNTVSIYDLVVAVANETHRMAEQWG